MREKSFGQSMNSKEHIQSELRDSGIDHVSDWQKSLNLEELLESEKEKGIKNESFDFKDLIVYLGENEKKSEKEKIEKFNLTEDCIERLELLKTMSLEDMVFCIKNYSYQEKAYSYLMNRLNFYKKLIQGKATCWRTVYEYDSEKGGYIPVEKEYSIDSCGVNNKTVFLGILRDVEFAAMMGTPELGIYKVVDKRLKEKKIRKTNMPELKGYYSGIHEGSIGYAYPILRKLYEKARKHVEGRMGDKKAEEQVIEHRSVILASNWLEEAMNYNNPDRRPESSYAGSLDEAIAWGRLGPQVKKQLLGMRRKIQGVDLHNIERFVGKSGDDKYDPERKRLFGQIKFLKEGYDQEKKQEFTTKENGFAVQKQHKWHEKEIERLNHKLEKARAEIEKASLPDEERELQLQSVLTKHQEAVVSVEQDYQNTVARLQERTPDQLLADLEQRQIVVNERHEKRKSLAQKALDLHFKINHSGPDHNRKPFAYIVDWINYAPLGTIKRGHKMMRLGMSDEVIVEYSLADIIAGKRGVTRDDLKVIHSLVEKAKGQDCEALQRLAAMMKVSNSLSVTGNEVSLEEVVDLAGKNFYGMTEALKMYDLEQVKQFIDQGINLQSITSTRTITQKYGHELSPIEVAEMASHDITGLDDSLRSFDLDQVRTLLSSDVNLPVAVAVLNNTRQFGYELSISQIANSAKNVHDIDDFTSALRGLSLSEVEKLFTVGVPYSKFVKVKSALEKYGHPSDFNSSFLVAQKLARKNEYDYLDNALQFYSLGEIDKIITKGSALSSVLEIRQLLEEKGIPTTLQEIIQFAQYAGDWNKSYKLTQAINTFGIDSVRKIVSKSCRLDKAIEVNNYINNDGSRSSESEISDSLRESLKKGDLDVVIAIAKTGNIEVAVKTIEAGFTIEEITRFPFLISPLIMKK